MSFCELLIDQPVEELQEKDAIPLGERDDTLKLPVEKVLTTPAVRKMALDHNVILHLPGYLIYLIDCRWFRSI